MPYVPEADFLAAVANVKLSFPCEIVSESNQVERGKGIYRTKLKFHNDYGLSIVSANFLVDTRFEVCVLCFRNDTVDIVSDMFKIDDDHKLWIIARSVYSHKLRRKSPSDIYSNFIP